MRGWREGAREAVLKLFRAGGCDLRQLPRALLQDSAARLALDLDHLIALRVIDSADMFFVQIGAFDGRTGDQLHEWVVRYGWSGILAEPHPHHFAKLQRTYADSPKLILRNVAVSDVRATRTLYSIREGVAGLPEWAPQVASFDRAVVEAHRLRGPRGEPVIEEIEVECITLSDLLADVERIDLLQVDTEGYDARIIRMFDFERFRPDIVRFENKHLSRADHDSVVRRLLGYGYSVAVPGEDTIAWNMRRRRQVKRRSE
jgi:FkbM family methyltransferase